MQCPVCPDERLVMTDRQGIEIDYCPKCRGVWLDRGELDKIIERAAPPPVPASRPVREVREVREVRDPRPHGGDARYYRKKKGGLLGELFDF